MLLLSLALAFGAGFNAPLQDPKPQVDSKRVAEAVAEIETALKDAKTNDERIAAIKKNVGVVDGKVIAAIEKGLKYKDVAVQAAAADALGRMDHPDALEALHKLYKSDVKRLRDDETLMPVVIKAIGRHASEKSVDLLSDDIFMQRTFPAIQARILSLGNIRSKKSIDALFTMMNKVGTNQLDTYMNLVRVALTRLTGADQGPSSQMWMAWWRKNESGFELPKTEPKMPDFVEKMWNEYWETTPGAASPPEGGEKKKG